MQDENLRILSDFGKQFEAGAKRIEDATQRLQATVEAAANLTGATGAPSESRAPLTAPLNARQQRGAGEGESTSRPGDTALDQELHNEAEQTRGVEALGFGGLMASGAGGSGGAAGGEEGLEGMGHSGDLLGNVFRRAIRAYALKKSFDLMKGNAWGFDPKTGARLEGGWKGIGGRATSRIGALGGRAFPAIIAGDLASQAFHSAWQGVTGYQFDLNSAALSLPENQFGVEAGFSNNGWLGTNFMSPAAMHAYHTNLQAYRDISGGHGFVGDVTGFFKSKFGLGGISVGQAREIEQTLQQYGWGQKGQGEKTDFLRDQMIQYTKQYSGVLKPDQMMQLGFDQTLKYGIGNLQDLRFTIQDLGAAAHAQGRNLKEYTDQLVAGAQQVSGATGASTSASASALNAYAQASGLSPEMAAGQLSDPQSGILGYASMRGKVSPWEIATMSTTQGKVARAKGANFFGDIFGRQLRAAELSGDKTKVNQIKNQMALMTNFGADRTMTGGLSLEQWVNKNQHFNMYNAMAADSTINHAVNEQELHKIMRTLGPKADDMFSSRTTVANPKYKKAYQAYVEAVGTNDKSKIAHAQRHLLDVNRSIAHHILSEIEGKQNKKSAERTQRVTVGLADDAKWLLKIVPDNRANRNNDKRQARASSGTFSGTPFQWAPND